MKQIIYPFLISFFIFVASCTGDEECRKDKYVKMGVGFYKTTLNTTTNNYVSSSLSIDSITIQGLKTNDIAVDSFLYNKSKKISKAYLPLNKFGVETVSRFVITFNETTDTVSIFHTNSELYLSLECGCLKAHTIDTVLTTNHFVKSVKINNHNVLNINAEHLQIFN